MGWQLLIAGMLGGLLQVAGSVAGRVLIALGIGYVSYSGVSVLLGSLETQVHTYIGGVPSDVIGILGALKVDVSVSILFSALAARFVLAGLTSGVLKRMVVK